MSLPKSQAQKLAERHPNQAELKPTMNSTGSPKRPRAMDLEAGKLWDFVVQELTNSNVVAAIDAPLLQAMCEHWSEYLRIQEQAEQLTDYSTPHSTRLLTNKSKALDSFKRIAKEFGMTALARNAVTAGKGTDPTGIVKRFLTGRGDK